MPFLPVSIFALSLCLLAGQALPAQSSNLGIPPMRNFPKKAYRAGTQNWDAAQDSRGVLFFANNEGLLQFDGSRWQCHPVANKTVVRSVAIDRLGRIFVGAQNEFGYFFPEKNGRLRYRSLVGMLPKDKRNFEDVWNIACQGDAVFFSTKHSVFQYQGEEIRLHEPGGDLSAMFATPEGLLVQRNLSEILIFENGGFRLLLQSPALQSELTGLMPRNSDTVLFSSLKNGLFCFSKKQLTNWPTPHDALLQEKRIYSATALPNGHLALATSLAGLIELDGQRRVFRHLTKKNGLQNNNLLHAFADRAGNLWLGLDNGIDFVALPSPFTSVVPDGDLQGTGYAAAVFENQLFLGVSNGVYRTDWKARFDSQKNPLFEKILATDGQVWSLNLLGADLILGHHEGSFQGKGQTFDRISKEPGAWTFVQLNDGFMLGGHYKGLVLYRKSGKNWVFDHQFEGLKESCRFMVKDDDGSVWVAHPYRGLFRIEWSAERKNELKVEFFNAANGLPSDLNNFVFPIAGKAVFATEKGVYRFDKSRSVFFPDEDFANILGAGKPINYLREDVLGNIWYIGGKEVGRLEVDDFGVKKKVDKRVFPELSEKLVAGFEFIFPLDGSNVFFGSEKGFIHFDADAPGSLDTSLNLVFSQITASGSRDSLLFGGFFLKNGQVSPEQDPEDLPVFEADLNNFRFAFSATCFGDAALLEYRSKLVGLDGFWSDWSSENVRDFTHLSTGDYRFEVQARMKNGRESAVARFEFRIRPPWYASKTALAVFALALLGVFVGFWIRQQRKFESEKESLAEQHQQITAQQQLEVEASKAALTDVLREKLEADIQFKNKELATATMHLVQKGEILQTVQENLNRILEKAGSTAVKKEIQHLLNLLDFDAKLDEDWAQFAVHFDQVHIDFLKRLRENYPQLSPTDYKLCAYLRMNLSTKEIAPLMNISVRGVEASRYRLRKKLNLPNDANLSDVMAGL